MTPIGSERAEIVQPGEEKAQGDLINIYKHLNGGCKEDRARLFSVVPSVRTGGSGHNPEHRRLSLNIKKYFFTVRVTEPCMGCPERLWSLPPWLETFKSHWDMNQKSHGHGHMPLSSPA